MNTVRLVLYRAKWGDKKGLDNGIATYSYLVNPHGWNKKKILCSHAEIWVPDTAGHYDTYSLVETIACRGVLRQPSGTCLTSTMGQARKEGAKYNGVCKRPASEVLFHPERWFYTEFNVNSAALRYALAWADLEIANNNGYDVGDIFKYFNPLARKQNLDDHKFICSGFSWAFLCKCAIYWQLIDPVGYATSRLCALFSHRMITDLPSPFRLALWCYDVGTKFTDLATGKEIVV